jgi:hypothetical protein
MQNQWYELCIPATLHVQANQPVLHLHSGMCGYDISISSPADQSRSGAEGTDDVSISEGLVGHSGSGAEGMIAIQTIAVFVL